MRHRACLGFTALLIVGVSACAATTPASYTFQKSKPTTHSYDQVWENLVGFFASQNIQVKNIAKDSGVIYAEAAAFDDNAADCGEPGGLERTVNRIGTFNVFVLRSGERPVVTVNTKFTEVRRNVPLSQYESLRTWTVDCNSKGSIERAILNAVP